MLFYFGLLLLITFSLVGSLINLINKIGYKNRANQIIKCLRCELIREKYVSQKFERQEKQQKNILVKYSKKI